MTEKKQVAGNVTIQRIDVHKAVNATDKSTSKNSCTCSIFL